MSRLSLALIVAAMLLPMSVATACHACPFCSGASLTLSEQLAKSDAALLGSLVASKQATEEVAAEAKIKVVDVLRDVTKTYEKGAVITLPRFIEAKTDDKVLLLGTKLDVLEWADPLPLSPATQAYLRNAPLLDAPPTERLGYFLTFLEHADATIANDAWSEFGNAPYKDIVPLAPKMPREKLRQWVLNPETSPTRLGLYGLMLGLCGNDEDIQLMEQRVVETGDNDYRLGIDGVMAGYLILTGERGLATIDKTKFENEKVPFSETYAALQSLRFMWQYGEGKIPAERLKQSMRLLLARPTLADIVIADIARWKDWAVMEDLMKLYGEGEYNVPSIKRAIIRYMFAAIKDVPKDAKETDPLPPHAAAAKKHLETLRAKDPKLVKDVERFLY